MKNLFSMMSNLQIHYHFKLDLQNVEQHTGGKWLIHGTKRHKDNQFQNVNPPVEYPSRESKHAIKESEGNTFSPIFKENIQGQKHPRGCIVAEAELPGPGHRQPKMSSSKWMEWP